METEGVAGLEMESEDMEDCGLEVRDGPAKLPKSSKKRDSDTSSPKCSASCRTSSMEAWPPLSSTNAACLPWGSGHLHQMKMVWDGQGHQHQGMVWDGQGHQHQGMVWDGQGHQGMVWDGQGHQGMVWDGQGHETAQLHPGHLWMTQNIHMLVDPHTCQIFPSPLTCYTPDSRNKHVPVLKGG